MDTGFYPLETSEQSCCMASAMEDGDAVFCMDCAKPLLRCMAFEECGGIVDETGRCPVCVRPHLQLSPGASMSAAVGGSVAVPLYLANGSAVGRPLFVKSLWCSEGGGEWREERLGWEKLAPGERLPASVTAREIDSAGVHELRIMWIVATQWKTREERFAFSSSLFLDIAPPKGDQNTTIQISSENQLNGNIIQVHERESSGGPTRVVETLDMNVTRLDREERALGLRGIDTDTRLCRDATFTFRGFADADVLADGRPIVTDDAALVFGRAHLRANEGESDARLVLRRTDDQGTIDDASTAISRSHFELFNENDRLILQVTATNGLRVDGKGYRRDTKVPLGDGAVIGVLMADADALSVEVGFRCALGAINEVVLTRRQRPIGAEGGPQ